MSSASPRPSNTLIVLDQIPNFSLYYSLTDYSMNSRLVVVENVYHQRPQQDPTLTKTGYTAVLKSKDRAYVRDFIADTVWMGLDCGWIKEASILVISNDEPPPSSESTEPSTPSAILEVSLCYDYPQAAILVYPGETMRIRPKDLGIISIRSVSGGIRYTVTAIPN